MNKYVDDIINDTAEMNKLNHGKNLAGNVTNEFRLDIEFMKLQFIVTIIVLSLYFFH